MLATLRSGAWLNETRIRRYLVIFLGMSILTIAGVIATAQGRLDATGRPLGADFSQIWVAGLETLRVNATQPYDIDGHMQALRTEFGTDKFFHVWAYPPFFLGLAAALASFPYLGALALWQIATLILYLISIVMILEPSNRALPLTILAALAFPAVLVNALHGQTGFLTTSLMGIAFVSLEKRPVLSGICLGILTYKPQLGLVLPVALLAGKHWVTIISATTTLILLILASIAVLGWPAWNAFFDNMITLRQLVLDQDGVGYAKLQSVFAATRLLGGGTAFAYFVQGLVAILTLIALVWIWRSDSDGRLKKSATITATLLTTPYCFDYDMMVLAPAIAFSVKSGIDQGFAPFEKSVLALAFFLPIFARPIAIHTSIPIGCVTILLLFSSAIYRAMAPRLPPSQADDDRKAPLFGRETRS